MRQAGDLRVERDGVVAYSGFAGTPLHADLQALGVRRLFVGGLATDYCVRATVLDARRLGFDVEVLEDAVRAVDAQPGDGERALADREQRHRPPRREALPGTAAVRAIGRQGQSASAKIVLRP